MFELEQAIADWRRELDHAGVKTSVVLDELESHLRDEIDAQMRLGVDERQAFQTAVEQIGQARTLARELTGEQKLRNAILLAATVLYSLVAGVPVLFRLGSFSDINSAQQSSALAAVGVAVTALFAGRLIARILPVVSSRCSRIVIYSSGVLLLFVWLALFYHHVMTRVEWNMSQLVVALLWALSPWGAVCGIQWGMEEAAVARTPKTHV